MGPVAAILFTVVSAALAAFQVALLAGAPLGHYAWGGADRVLPPGKRVGSVIAIVLYAAFAFLALERAGVMDVFAPTPVVDIAMWVVTVYLATGIVLNAISRSRKERFVMTPVALVLTVLALLVALS